MIATPKSIYFIEGLDTGIFKIGITANISDRLAGLQGSSPITLVLRAMILPHEKFSAEFLERQLHRIFKEFRKHGEWFSLPENWVEILPSSIKKKLLFESESKKQLIELSFQSQTAMMKEREYKRILEIKKKEELEEKRRTPTAIVGRNPLIQSLLPFSLFRRTPEEEARVTLEETKRHEAYVTTWQRVSDALVSAQVIENKQLIN